jgi:hypothetical protein
MQTGLPKRFYSINQKRKEVRKTFQMMDRVLSCNACNRPHTGKDDDDKTTDDAI